MSARLAQLRAERARARELLRARLPTLFPAARPNLIRVDRSAIVLGRNEADVPIRLPLRARLEHMHVVGTTGGGKTKLLEHGMRQDVADGRGVCLVDPHGNHPDSLYRSFLSWLDERGYTKSRVVHLIDANAGTHVTGLNPLALPSEDYDCAVIAEAMQEALERVWGEEDMNSKPTMQRVLAATLSALTELGLTLAEARHLFDPQDRHGLRAWVVANLRNQEAREELEWLHEISFEARGRQDFRLEVTGPRASDKAAQLLGRLLTRMLFFHAVRREHPERPFFFYLDECQLYLSGDVSRLLSEARKYGLGCILSHQYLAQFEATGLDLLEAVKNTTNVKVVLRIKDPEEAAALADMVLPYDLEAPVRALIKPTVVGQRITKLKGESVSDQVALTEMRTETQGESTTHSYSYSESVAETVGEAISTAESLGVSNAEGVSSADAMTAGTALSRTDMFSVDGNQPVQMAIPVGVSYGYGTESGASQARGTSSTQGSNSSTSRAATSSQATTTASSWSEGVANTSSSATSIGRGETRGRAETQGTQEAFESIYENRPAAVHSLENIRYMAGTVLRHLTTGRAAISFVDADGMKTAGLRVAHVESHALPAAEFEALRARVLDASPSATPIAAALAAIESREQALIAQAAKAVLLAEPETPDGYRVKRKRLPKTKS